METIKTSVQPFYSNNPSRILSSRHGGFSLIFTTWMLTLFFHERTMAQDKNLAVRLAKLQIDSTQPQSYKAALKEEIETWDKDKVIDNHFAG